MNREEKAVQVEDLHRRFAATPFVVLADFKGSTVAQMNTLRRNCEKGGVFFQVVKNTLAVRALEGTGKEGLADHFRGNIGVLIAHEDAIATAKLVKQFKMEMGLASPAPVADVAGGGEKTIGKKVEVK